MQRRITYELGAEAVTPSRDLVRVISVDEADDWGAPNLGTVEPQGGQRFVKMSVEYTPVELEGDIGEIADAFELELDSGDEVSPLRETYNVDELQGRFGERALTNEKRAGQIWFEVPSSRSVTAVIFRCRPIDEGSEPQAGIEIVLRWPVVADASTGSNGGAASTSAPLSPPPAATGSGMAIASLVFGVVSVFLGILVPLIPGGLAIVFGGVGISNANHRGAPGRGMAIAGLILGILSVLAFVVYVST